MRHPRFAKRRGHARDDRVKRTITVGLHRLPRAFGQRDRVQRGTGRNRADLFTSITENRPHIAFAIVHPAHDKGRKFKKLPQQIKGVCGRVWGDLVDDHRGLRAQVLDQSVPLAPPDIAFGPTDRDQPLADVTRQFRGAKVVTKLKPQATFHIGAAGADLDQQLGQTVRPEGSKICGVQGLFRHRALLHRICSLSKGRMTQALADKINGDAPARQFGQLLHRPDHIAGLTADLAQRQRRH